MRTARGQSLNFPNGSPFGGFQQIYADQNKVWYVNNYAWLNYESGGTITVTCLNGRNPGNRSIDVLFINTISGRILVPVRRFSCSR
uniref:hypothetical protein n=1 Tax=Escherichia coli TaxID=562 RepID=UPI0020424B0C|nr:hypothetical protein [Escherichia coli]